MIEAELPDGTVLEFPDGTPRDVVQRTVKKRLGVASVEAPKPDYRAQAIQMAKPELLQPLKNIAGGAIRGAGSIGATAMRILPNMLGGDTAEENAQRRSDIDAGLQNLIGADPESFGYQAAKLGGEIAGTAGVPVGLAALGTRAGMSANALSTLASGGFRGGNMLQKAAAGATVGGISAGMVNPNDAATGAGIGGVLPGGVKVAGLAGAKIGAAYRSATAPQKVKIAQKIAQEVGRPVQEIISALEQTGPQIVPKTTAQILMNPTVSQMQRSAQAAGGTAIGDAAMAQQAAMRDALNRVSPQAISVQDAAERAGGAIGDYAFAERARMSKLVNDAFEGVDPFKESAIYLPLDEMQGAASKYLGRGTFGTGGKADQALSTARAVGTMELPSIAATTKKAIGKSQNLEQAVRAAGGIKPGAGGLGGEIGDLMNRQSGTSGLVNKKGGKSVDLLAEEMYMRGFIPDDDPATLLQMLRNGGGRNVFASDVADNAFAGRMEAAMGDLPGAESIPKTVDFQTIQNLRSSIGEAAEQSSLAGNKKEAAALRQMVADIDGKLQSIADVAADPAEFFAPDMVESYAKARAMHADKMKRFETGPQAGIFRKAGDGQMQVQGAEIPGKFFSGRRSQVEDMQSFKRLVKDDAALMNEMKRFAITEGAATSDARGNLTSKFIDWAQSRTGANRELFSKSELATIEEVGKAVQRQIDAESLGRVSGSDTAQKARDMMRLGLLDNRAVDVLASRTPLIGSFTGPMLQSLRNTAKQTQAQSIAELLSNPASMASALRQGNALQNLTQKQLRQNALLQMLQENALKAAPVIAAD